MDAFETIADRRIAAAREAGLFDDLALRGRPIPDLDRQRPPGWWASRLIKRERSILRAEELDRELQLAMPGLWRLESEEQVAARVAELNERIDDHNRISTWERRDRISPDHVLHQWRRFRGPETPSSGPGR